MSSHSWEAPRTSQEGFASREEAERKEAGKLPVDLVLAGSLLRTRSGLSDLGRLDGVLLAGKRNQSRDAERKRNPLDANVVRLESGADKGFVKRR